MAPGQTKDAGTKSMPPINLQGQKFIASCTPGYYNNEGKAIDQEIARYSGGYPKGPLAFFKYIQEWRSDGKFEGIDFKTVG